MYTLTKGTGAFVSSYIKPLMDWPASVLHKVASSKVSTPYISLALDISLALAKIQFAANDVTKVLLFVVMFPS
jgi:hypothetical protein